MQLIEIFSILKEAGFVTCQEEMLELDIDSLNSLVMRANEMRIDNQVSELYLTAVASQGDDKGIKKTAKSLEKAKREIRKNDPESKAKLDAEEQARSRKAIDGLFSLLNKGK